MYRHVADILLYSGTDQPYRRIVYKHVKTGYFRLLVLKIYLLHKHRTERKTAAVFPTKSRGAAATYFAVPPRRHSKEKCLPDFSGRRRRKKDMVLYKSRLPPAKEFLHSILYIGLLRLKHP